jgi:hypothetical protein
MVNIYSAATPQTRPARLILFTMRTDSKPPNDVTLADLLGLSLVRILNYETVGHHCVITFI